ncbi:MAG: Protease 3 precursor [Bacteroidetes bacterium ADurb.Bin217]|nr:MAG: Protease 3 precursor [Bacteroidetes bacterium ADurb.Bin217]
MVVVDKEIFFELPNKTKVVLSKSNSLVSYICLFVNVGTRDEPLGCSGVMHVIEHLLFKGTKTRSYFELMALIESVGGDMNAYTSKEETCIYISIQNQYLERAIDVLHDIFYNSDFSEQEFNKEREVIIDEINSYKDTPSELIFDEFEELFFNNHELAANILGTEESLQQMNVGDVRDVYSKRYVSERLIISYVGGVDLDLVLSYIMNYFTALRKNDECVPLRINFTGNPLFAKTFKRETYQTHCMLGAQAPSMYANDKTAMVLLNNLLGGTSFNALLNLSLREERGLTYNIESNYTAYTDVGICTIYFGTDEDKVTQCKTVIFDVCNSIMEHGLSEQQLIMYKQQLVGQLALSFDNYVSLMISNAKSYMNYDKVDSYEEIINKIESVTNNQIIDLAQSVLNPKSLSCLEYK